MASEVSVQWVANQDPSKCQALLLQLVPLLQQVLVEPVLELVLELVQQDQALQEPSLTHLLALEALEVWEDLTHSWEEWEAWEVSEASAVLLLKQIPDHQGNDMLLSFNR